MTRTAKRYKGKVALVTGASGGQGQSQVRMLAEEGAAVVLADVVDGPARKLARDIKKSGGRAIFVHLDVTSAAEWKNAIRRIRSEFGALHVLINNAGVISRTGIDRITMDEWSRVINVNLMGPMLGIKTAAPLIRDSGGGAIVNIGSTAALAAHRGVAYTSSKWGVRGLTSCAAMEYLDWGIRVNAVHPAQVSDTGISAHATPAYRSSNQRIMPMKRAARPDEVTSAVLFLASDDASYINAADLTIDGGALNFGLTRVRKLIEEDYVREQRPAGVRKAK